MYINDQLIRADIEPRASDYSLALSTGRIWLNTGTGLLKIYDGSATRVVVFTDLAQTLTNKSLSDSTTYIIDNSDPTKRFQFQASGITGGQTRVYTMPDYDATIATLAGTETLTNKTISGASNTFSNIDLAAAVTGVLPVANGGTNSSSALNNNRVMISSGSAVVEASAITASRALISDANGIPTHATTTSTEVGYLNGVTSAVQTQLNAKVAQSVYSAKGSLLVASAASTPADLTVGTNNYLLTADSTAPLGVKWASPSSVAILFSRNYAYNGEFRFFQRQTPGTLTNFQDDAYGPDRWYILTSGGAVNVSVARVAEVISASPTQYVCQVRQANATARRIGLAQIIPYEESIMLRGQEVQFSFYARTDSTEIPNLRAGIVEWTGTADSVTSDIVDTWGSTPTLIANAAYINTPGDLALTGSWAQHTVTATFGSSMNNAILFVWTEAEEAQNDDFYLSQAQFTPGATPFAWKFIAKSYEQDLRECQRFYEKSYPVDTSPSAVSDGNQVEVSPRAYTKDGSTAVYTSTFKVVKRATPTVLFYSPASGNSGNVRDDSGGADTSADGGWIGTTAASVDFTMIDTRIYRWHWTASAEL